MLEGFLSHKKEPKEYISALVVSEDQIEAALWETKKDGDVTILKTSAHSYTGDWEKAIIAADEAVTEIEVELPEGVELKKVVFGLFPEWVSEDHIKETYLKRLKELTSKLSLTPLGYVEVPNAVAHLLQKDEGTQQTVILVGIESKHVTVSLFKIGKLAGSTTLPRSDKITSDLEKALSEFTDIEVLPSRILLYGTIKDLGSLRDELLNYPWQKKANFLHVPKIEVLAPDFAVKAVGVASSTEITPQVDMVEEADVSQPEIPTSQTTSSSREVETIAEDLGFVPERGQTERTVVETEIPDEEVANVAPVPVPRSKEIDGKKFTLPQFSFPKFTISFKLPHVPKFGLIGIALFMLLLLGGGLGAVFWFIPKATVTLLVSAKTLEREEQVTIDPGATSADPGNKILPAKEVNVEVSGTKKISTSGKKTIGEHARGEVTIYNKTLNTKVFKKGTVLTAGKLKFTLDEETQVASASEGVGSLTYGTSKTNLTASEIGTAGNVSPGTEFAFVDLPTSSYSARNEKALSGGSSRDIAVVSRDDQKKARDEAILELTKQAESEVAGKLASSEKLLENSSESKVLKETFDKEIGEEGDEVSVDMTIAVSAYAYNGSDLYALVDAIVADNVPDNYEYQKEQTKIKVADTGNVEEDVRVFSTRFTVELWPKVETGNLAKKIAGKTLTSTTEYIKSVGGVAGVEYDIQAPISMLKEKLPLNSGNIKVEIASL